MFKKIINYNNKTYQLISVDNKNELSIALELKADIICFLEIYKDYGQWAYKFKIPNGYKYMSNRVSLVKFKTSLDGINWIDFKHDVCIYKAELHGQVNKIINLC